MGSRSTSTFTLEGAVHVQFMWTNASCAHPSLVAVHHGLSVFGVTSMVLYVQMYVLWQTVWLDMTVYRVCLAKWKSILVLYVGDCIVMFTKLVSYRTVCVNGRM